MQPVVLITGALGGIGQAMCERFTAGGWAVFGTDLNASALAALQAEGKLAGAQAADIRKPDACREVVAALLASRGRLDALVNCAGVWREGPVESFSEEDFDIVLDVNLKATFFMCSASIPALRQSKGCLLYTSPSPRDLSTSRMPSSA